MARVQKITRTIVATKASVMCVDPTNGQTSTQEVTLSGTFKDDKTLLKRAGKMLDNETTKAVFITGKTEQETLYGMDEDKFIASAEILPLRTKKQSN